MTEVRLEWLSLQWDPFQKWKLQLGTRINKVIRQWYGTGFQWWGSMPAVNDIVKSITRSSNFRETSSSQTWWKVANTPLASMRIRESKTEHSSSSCLTFVPAGQQSPSTKHQLPILTMGRLSWSIHAWMDLNMQKVDWKVLSWSKVTATSDSSHSNICRYFCKATLFLALSLSTVHTISSWYQLPTMARETRSGRIADSAVAIGTFRSEAREQLRVEKKRKRYELEQAKKQKKQDASCVLPSGDGRASRSQALEINKLYAVPASETPPSPAPHPRKDEGHVKKSPRLKKNHGFILLEA